MNDASNPIYLYCRLRLRSPAIVKTFSGDPNSAATHAFIPGSAIRGAVAGRLLASGVHEGSEEFRRMVLSGEIRYFHAYPELSGERSLPCPLSWRSEKADRMRAIDLAAFSGAIDNSVDADDFENGWPKEALVSVPAPFSAAAISAGARTIGMPRIESRLHQQRDRIKGRSWKDRDERRHGALFAYEYLEADQIFRGVIQIMSTAVSDVEYLRELLGAAPILIGRSRRAGYGGEALVEFTGQGQSEYENMSGLVLRDLPAGQCFRAFLTSAYIGRHPKTGQIDPTVLHEELRGRLGETATVERTRWSFETVGGFNQKWRLEVPQAQAVAAGAVLVLKSTSGIAARRLREIEHDGIGERRIEGYGRVLFMEHSDDHETILLQRRDDDMHSTAAATLGDVPDEHRRQLNLLEERIVLAAARAELDRVAAFDLAAGAQNRPTTSLLGRLRTLFRHVADEQAARTALSNLQTWCSDKDNPQALKRNAKEKLDRCKVNGKTFREWLRQLADAAHDGAGWQAMLDASGKPTTLTALAARYHLTSPAAAQDLLHRHSALLRVYLIDSLLGSLARLNRRGAR
jgi:CRISPR-associated protein Csx10